VLAEHGAGVVRNLQELVGHRNVRRQRTHGHAVEEVLHQIAFVDVFYRDGIFEECDYEVLVDAEVYDGCVRVFGEHLLGFLQVLVSLKVLILEHDLLCVEHCYDLVFIYSQVGGFLFKLELAQFFFVGVILHRIDDSGFLKTGHEDYDLAVGRLEFWHLHDEIQDHALICSHR